eukprot:3303261-Pleurochrysis_carterae.AAC.2
MEARACTRRRRRGGRGGRRDGHALGLRGQRARAHARRYTSPSSVRTRTDTLLSPSHTLCFHLCLHAALFLYFERAFMH